MVESSCETPLSRVSLANVAPEKVQRDHVSAVMAEIVMAKRRRDSRVQPAVIDRFLGHGEVCVRCVGSGSERRSRESERYAHTRKAAGTFNLIRAQNCRLVLVLILTRTTMIAVMMFVDDVRFRQSSISRRSTRGAFVDYNTCVLTIMRGSKTCQQAKMKVLAPIMLHNICSPFKLGSAGGGVLNLLMLLDGGVQLF